MTTTKTIVRTFDVVTGTSFSQKFGGHGFGRVLSFRTEVKTYANYVGLPSDFFQCMLYMNEYLTPPLPGTADYIADTKHGVQAAVYDSLANLMYIGFEPVAQKSAVIARAPIIRDLNSMWINFTTNNENSIAGCQVWVELTIRFEDPPLVEIVQSKVGAV